MVMKSKNRIKHKLFTHKKNHSSSGFFYALIEFKNHLSLYSIVNLYVVENCYYQNLLIAYH